MVTINMPRGADTSGKIAKTTVVLDGTLLDAIDAIVIESRDLHRTPTVKKLLREALMQRGVKVEDEL